MIPKQNQWSESPFIAADNGSSVSSSFKVTLGENLKSWLMAIAFVSAISGNLIFGVLYLQAERKLTTTEDLKRYELTDFQTTHFNPLEAQVKSDHDLIQAYGLNKIVAETCKR